MQTTLGALANLLEGTLMPPGAETVPISEVRGIDEAPPGCLTYVEKIDLLEQALATPCAALLVPPQVETADRPFLQVRNPRLAFALTLRHLHPTRRAMAGVHATAIVDPSARLGDNVSVGPFVVIGPDAVIGDRTRLDAHCWVGTGCSVGPDCWLRPHVSLHGRVHIGARVSIQSHSVIGARVDDAASDGPSVVLGDDCELGARVIIEGAADATTQMGSGTKTDNLLTVRSGATVGNHCLLVAYSCVDRGAQLEDYVTLAGQSAVAATCRVGTQSILAGRGIIRTDAPARSTLSDDPARPHKDALRARVREMRVPDLCDRVTKLEVLSVRRDLGSVQR
jgi:UDP-3-O-[3-hydroxymyristoyl] glucosamine N-acyltransferase